MSKKLLALATALVLTLGMTVTAFAANSPSAGMITGNTPITTETLDTFVKSTTVTTTVAGTTITKVEDKDAKTLASSATSTVGANAAIATMVDINVPSGTGEAQFTLGVDGLVKGQDVTVLHLKKDGTVEKCKVNEVKNGAVSFTMTSYSPVAVVVNATAPKTGEVNTMFIMFLAIAGVAGAAYFGRKYATL